MGLYLAKRITRPVLLLSEAAKEIGAGHYDHRIEHEGSDEFGSMVEAFNAIRPRLLCSKSALTGLRSAASDSSDLIVLRRRRLTVQRRSRLHRVRVLARGTRRRRSEA